MASGLRIVLVLCLFSCCHGAWDFTKCKKRHASCLGQCSKTTEECCKLCNSIRRNPKHPTKRKERIGVPWYIVESRTRQKGGNTDEIGASRFLKIASLGNMSPVNQHEETYNGASFYNPNSFNYYEYYGK